jgi:hypothetical protein
MCELICEDFGESDDDVDCGIEKNGLNLSHLFIVLRRFVVIFVTLTWMFSLQDHKRDCRQFVPI